ncbi:MAG: MotA/TolQ/ExbB proton channel family protein [Planctomycetia bacterium]|nr:MotA/TolQ/ExbB proton channel family protein [Planctomycetia bacterium]
MKNHLNALLGWLMIGLVVVAVGSSLAPRAALAQEDAAADADEPAAEKAAPKKDAGKAAEGEGAPEGGEQNFLLWVAEVSGFIGVVLLLLSIYFVAVTARMFMELRPEVLTPLEALEESEKLMQSRDFTGLYKRLKGDNSYFCKVASAGIAELPNGIAEARDAMERVGEVETINLERKISMLAVLGTLGPMIGLLGTLKGMIGAFSQIAISGTQLKASAVAGNISEALVLTFEGVALSVPAIYFFALFRNRISSFTATAMLDADAFVRRLYTAMKSKPATTTSAPAPASAPPARA